MYIMLQGLPGVRKSSAISIGTSLLKQAGYVRFAPDRMSRQSFLDELWRINQPDFLGLASMDDLMDMQLSYPYEMSIHAGEFIDFIGQGDKDYLMLLTNLWDNLDEYNNPKISSRSVCVEEPTINLLSASTPENLNMAFPSNVMDTGTLSRMLFIHSPPTGRKILIPTRGEESVKDDVVRQLREMKEVCTGSATLSPAAYEALEYIYNHQQPLDDQRFLYYSSRRLTHLFKMCLIMAASRLSTQIEEYDVLMANTVLVAAEMQMPKALGHFGRSKQAAISHSILDYLEDRGVPIGIKTLYNVFAADFNKEADFQGALYDLQSAGKLAAVKMKDHTTGLTTVGTTLPDWAKDLLMLDALTAQERSALGV